MGVPELWGVITSLHPGSPGRLGGERMYQNLAVEAGVSLSELITYLDVDGEDKVLVTEPESVLAAKVRFWDLLGYSIAFQAVMFVISPVGIITGEPILPIIYL